MYWCVIQKVNTRTTKHISKHKNSSLVKRVWTFETVVCRPQWLTENKKTILVSSWSCMRDKKSHHFKKHNTIWGPPKETLTVKNFDQEPKNKKQHTTKQKKFTRQRELFNWIYLTSFMRQVVIEFQNFISVVIVCFVIILPSWSCYHWLLSPVSCYLAFPHP